MRRVPSSLSLGILLICALAGCSADLSGGTTGSGESDASTADRLASDSTSASHATPVPSVNLGEAPDPVGLVNLWRVSGVEGEGANTWLRIDATDFQLWRDCGITSGAWQSNGHLFDASTSAADAACAPSMTVPWLESVTSFRDIDGRWELTDSTHEVVATLTIDGAPEPSATAADFFTQPPVVTDATRAALRQSVPLADGLVPATADDLVGRWVPVGYDGEARPEKPYALLEHDGTWEGSDGCNGSGGSWAGASDGTFLATTGPSTLIACDGYSIDYAISRAMRVSIDGGVLSLFDADGIELVQLERA